MPISLVIIAKNEENNIRRCIQSAPFVSEIVVVENGSTDKTRSISEDLGAKVVSQEWLGFGPQKNYAVGLAANDWILSLDADEALSSELSREIEEKFRSLDAETLYEFPRISFHLKRWIHHGGWYPDYQPRLFHRKHSRWNSKMIHESVESRRKERFRSNLQHFVFRDFSHQMETNNRYSTLQAKEYLASGGRFSFFKLLTKPWVKFFECYFLKLGFLDGLPGFAIAVGAGHSVFMRWIKIWEQQK